MLKGLTIPSTFDICLRTVASLVFCSILDIPDVLPPGTLQIESLPYPIRTLPYRTTTTCRDCATVVEPLRAVHRAR